MRRVFVGFSYAIVVAVVVVVVADQVSHSNVGPELGSVVPSFMP